jgi:shikimate 5-dehydrogenase
LAPRPTKNDEVLTTLPSYSVVINATGLGKDAPGSPLTDDAVFPLHSIAWDLNYRGDLIFLDQARKQQEERSLRVEDGWIYFIHGWTQVISEVFHIDIPTSGPEFDKLANIAATSRA